jgi:hypothetical protein
MGPGDVLGLMTVVFGIGGTIVLRGPLGRALADRIAGRSRAPDPESEAGLERALDELDVLKRRLAEVEERQDFTERVLAGHRAPPGAET